MMPICCLCEQTVGTWRADAKMTACSSLLRVLGAVGLDADRHRCPTCGADDHERHTWLYLSRTGVLDPGPGKRALHVGREPALRAKLARLAFDWTFADESDLERILGRCGAGAFDLIICNGVLPAVADVEATIRILALALSECGQLVTQSVYAPMLKRTLAFTGKPTQKAAQLFFGGERHRRLIGSDLAQMFSAVGLRGGPYRHEDVLPGVDAAAWGCDSREPFFLFSRHPCLTSPS